MSSTVKNFIDVARSFIGYNEKDGSFKKILDIYNGHKPLARGYAIKYTDQWCDCFVSTVGIVSDAVDIIGTEVGVERHVDIFKNKGIWIEDGSIVPEPGYLIVFNWEKNTQPNDGYSDHIGIVESVAQNGDNIVITTIEGNRSNSVKRVTYNVGDGNIRGYAAPKYSSEEIAPSKSNEEIANEVISGLWGNGEDRKNKLIAAGYNYDEIQKIVNEKLTPEVDYYSLAEEIYRGDWGNGEYRKNKLIAAGYDYDKAQKAVTERYYS